MRVCLRTGQEHTKNWMDNNVRLVVTDDTMQHAVRDITRATSKLGEGGGTVYLWQDFTNFWRNHLNHQVQENNHRSMMGARERIPLVCEVCIGHS